MAKSLPYYIGLTLIVQITQAEVVTDGSLGAQVNLLGPDFQIGEQLGSRQGNNLFHSFQRFNIANQQSATFTGDSAIENVVSRVTGGQVSLINGLLKSEIGQADFYFINPAGIVFGANAQVDVPAAFYMSTAARLNFADGSQFETLNPDSSQLTMATPESFGFTSEQTGRINMTANGLVFKPGQKVSFSSHSMNIGQANITGTDIQLQLFANGNQEQTLELQTLPDHSLAGDINIVESDIDITGNGNEQLHIRAGNLTMNRSTLFIDNSSSLDHQAEHSVDIRAEQFSLDGSLLTSEALDSGRAGDMSIHVDDQFNILNGSLVSASTFATGDAGNIEISAKNIELNRQGSSGLTTVSSSALTDSTGNAGSINIDVSESLLILNGGVISSSTRGQGDAGLVDITSADLRIDGQGSNNLTLISSSSLEDSTGAAGVVSINSSESIQVINEGQINSDTFSEGDAGDVLITAGNADVSAGGQISSSTFSAGDAGLVQLQANSLIVDGQNSQSLTAVISSAEHDSTGVAGAVNISVDTDVSVLNKAQISSDTFGSGDAGDISINANGLLTVARAGQISSSTHGIGNAGVINIQSGEILVDGNQLPQFTGIYSATFPGSAGDADLVNITVDGLLRLIDGGAIGTGAFGQGNAGAVTIKASDIEISGSSLATESVISSSVFKGSSGEAGSVEIEANNLSLSEQGQISSDTEVAGDAGNVSIQLAESLRVTSGGQIRSVTEAAGNAGTVEVSANEILIDSENGMHLTGISSTAIQGASGDAGLISIQTQGNLSLSNSRTLINSDTFGAGNAGIVDVNSMADINLASNARISSSTHGIGSAGDVNLDAALSVNITSGAQVLSQTNDAGEAGIVNIKSTDLLVDGLSEQLLTTISSTAEFGSTGDAGLVLINSSDSVQLLNGGEISSNTVGTGDAGNIDINTMQLTVTNSAEISSSTRSGGDAGLVEIDAGNILIDGEQTNQFTGVFSVAFPGSTGNADSVVINNDSLTLTNGGVIASATYGMGDGGFVDIKANQILIDGNRRSLATGISSSALEQASGMAGSVNIESSQIELVNGGKINSDTEVVGDAGSVILQVSDLLSIQSGSQISSTTSGSGDAGEVEITSSQLLIDGADSIRSTGISSTALPNSSGNAGFISINNKDVLIRNSGQINTDTLSSGDAGNIELTVENQLSLRNGGKISSNTANAGTAGFVSVSADKIIASGNPLNNTGITSIATEGSTGNAGTIEISSQSSIDLLNNAEIISDTFGSGDAGDISVNASSASLTVTASSQVSSSTWDQGSAGNVNIDTASVTVDGEGNEGFTGIFSVAFPGSEGDADLVTINSRGDLAVLNNGTIASGTFATGNAGAVEISAANIRVDGNGRRGTSISSSALQGSEGFAGSVNVQASDLIVSGSGKINSDAEGLRDAGNVSIQSQNRVVVSTGGQISSTTSQTGDAGLVEINTDELLIDGNNSTVTGVSTTALNNSIGEAGTIQINATDSITLLNRGLINSDTFGSGDAGDVTVTAQNQLVLTNGGKISSSTSDQGDAGLVQTSSNTLEIDGLSNGLNNTGIFSSALAGSGGDAGTINVSSRDNITIKNQSLISSDTLAQGIAGDINLNTPALLTILNAGQISSSTFAQGDAGIVDIQAGEIQVDGAGSDLFTGIYSASFPGSSGNADTVILNSRGQISLVNAGVIGTATFSVGNAGTVEIIADEIVIDGQSRPNRTFITSSAFEGAAGNVGTVNLTAADRVKLTNGGSVLITSATQTDQPALFQPEQILINADLIEMENGIISAESTGNIDASDIVINSPEINLQQESKILTSANDGNGGDITLSAADFLYMQNSQITTSVFGLVGDGGDIAVNSPVLVLDTGFIQANTVALGAAGGNINLDIDNLIPSGNLLFSGDEEPLDFSPGVFGFNVIQAAAPDGVSGQISNTAPELNITSALADLEEPELDLEQIGMDPCSPTARQNTLKGLGRGAVTSLKKGQHLQTLEKLIDSKPEKAIDKDVRSEKNKPEEKPFNLSNREMECQKNQKQPENV